MTTFLLARETLPYGISVNFTLHYKTLETGMAVIKLEKRDWEDRMRL